MTRESGHPTSLPDPPKHSAAILQERVRKELVALERWAGEQNAGNAFATQVNWWARVNLERLDRWEADPS